MSEEPEQPRPAPVVLSESKEDWDWYAKAMQHPTWRDFYEREMGRQQRMESVRAAFIAARRKA